MTNLELMNEAESRLAHAERISFENYLIGILSVTVDQDKWAYALDSALGCLERVNSYRAATEAQKAGR